MRRLTVGIAAVALAAIALIVATALAERLRGDGPLQASSSYRVRAPLSAEEALTWSVALPFNPAPSELRLREVVLQAPSGLTILGILTTYGVRQPDGSCLSSGATYGFPPTAVRADGTTVPFPTRSVPGTIVPSEDKRACESHPSVSVGVRRDSSMAISRIGIEGLRVIYEHLGAEYEVLLPYSLAVDPR